MIGKSRLFVLLAAAAVVCGCGSEQKKEPKAQAKLVKLQTSMGDIVIELDQQAAPVTVENFLRYVDEGFYDGTLFHRVIPRFMIQGGGLTAEMEKKQAHDPITNEAGNGLKNKRGTIAMARSDDPDSATCQFFINHIDNPRLDYAQGSKPGYVVFGKVVEGMDVVDAIAWVETTTRAGRENVPVEPVIIKSARVASQ